VALLVQPGGVCGGLFALLAGVDVESPTVFAVDPVTKGTQGHIVVIRGLDQQIFEIIPGSGALEIGAHVNPARSMLGEGPPEIFDEIRARIAACNLYVYAKFARWAAVGYGGLPVVVGHSIAIFWASRHRFADKLPPLESR